MRNRKEKTAADIVADASVWDLLISYFSRRNRPTQAAAATAATAVSVIPAVSTVEATGPLEVAEGSKNPADAAAAQEERSVNKVNECVVCSEVAPDIKFEPCGHTIACSDCAQRMKKCLECHVVIVSKSSAG